MIKKVSTCLGIGLVILWMAGLGSPAASLWFTWLAGLAAVFAFTIATLTPDFAPKKVRVGRPVALAIGLFILSIVGFANGVVPWLAWWTTIFAWAFLLLGIAGTAERRPPLPESHGQENQEREDFRKSA